MNANGDTACCSTSECTINLAKLLPPRKYILLYCSSAHSVLAKAEACRRRCEVTRLYLPPLVRDEYSISWEEALLASRRGEDLIVVGVFQYHGRVTMLVGGHWND
jgi:hypothetical protein